MAYICVHFFAFSRNKALLLMYSWALLKEELGWWIMS